MSRPAPRPGFLPELALFVEHLRRHWHQLKGRVRAAVLPPRDEAAELRSRIHDRLSRLGRVYEDGNSAALGYTYHPIPFEAFADTRAHRPQCADRLDLILETLPLETGDWVLDAGANVGFFAFGLEARGARVEAWEPQSDTFEIGAALAKLYARDVLYINKPISSATVALLRPRYKAVLLLSVFHWIVKQDGEENAVTLLRELARRTDYLYVEVPSNAHDAAYRHEWFSTPESGAAALRRALPHVPFEQLGSAADWNERVLWRIDCRVPAGRGP